ncbi:hypothetical protein ACQY1Q_06020 [Tenacibaculum sp. TC6]|uniref:hypothetical protein n=1 Tax=Tenacibaculum sp. TC6 TaxID=3423223 RepID=UPI003D364158
MKIQCKKRLFGKFPFIPLPEARAVINEIIAKQRNLPIEIARYKKYLRPSEVEEYLKNYDIEIKEEV